MAWIRFGETTDADGKRVLVIDEIQSKRHQDGREKGYISVKEKATIDAIRAKKEELSKKRRDWDYRTGEAWRQFQAGDITEQEYNRLWDTQFDAEKKQLDEIERGINSEVNVYDSFTKIPSAPFEKNWAELAMKRMLRYAAENGFDKVAWTTGDQQGERYDITKTISKIEKESKNRTECYVDLFESETGGVISFTVDKSSGEIIEQHRGSGFEGKNLSDVLGKSLAHEILSSRKRVFEQDNLRIGGEGMRAFYDQMLPSFVRKYAKKWGATVGEVTMPDLEENNTMHSVDVTPAMRESVMQGQPKFSLRSDAMENALFERANMLLQYCNKANASYGVKSTIVVAATREDFANIQIEAGYKEPDALAMAAYLDDEDVILLNSIEIETLEELAEVITHENAHSITHTPIMWEKLVHIHDALNEDDIRAWQEKFLPDYEKVSTEQVLDEIISTFVAYLSTKKEDRAYLLRSYLMDKKDVNALVDTVRKAAVKEYGDEYIYIVDALLPLLKENLQIQKERYEREDTSRLYNFVRHTRGLAPTYYGGANVQADDANGNREGVDRRRENEEGVRGGEQRAEVGRHSLRALDAPYLEAVERGDMETAQRMVLEAAERSGYLSDTSYQGSLAFNGAAPMANAYFDTKEQRKDAWDNGEYDGTMSLGDYADNNIDTNDLEWQLSDRGNYRRAEDYTKESIDNINNAINGGNHKITIYRTVPNSVEEGTVRNGDWVTPSRKYAEYHIELQDWVGGRIIEQEVDIDNIWWNGDDINEWGYDDGSNYGYRNTPNNRKLLDPVTYDDNGNVIPLSERFNPAKEDVRYSISESYAPFSTTEAGEIAEQMRADGALPSEIYARTGWWWDAKGRMRNYPRDKQPRAAKIVELQKAEGTYDERTSFGNIEAENVGKQGLGSTTEEQVRLWLKNRHLVAIDNIRKKYKMYRDTARLDYQEKQRRLQLYLLVVVAEFL